MKYYFIALVMAFLTSCGALETSEVKDIPDAEKGLQDPWFYIGEWHFDDEQGRIKYAKMFFNWDSAGRLHMQRMSERLDGRISEKSSDHSGTLDFLRDKIKYLDENRLYYPKTDSIFIRITPRIPTPKIFGDSRCRKGGSFFGTCEFYTQCVEGTYQCGTSGYPIAYGKKYCDRFSALTFTNPKGARWRDSTRTRLQTELWDFLYSLSNKSISCQDVRRIAFDTHPKAYTDEPNSICFLSPFAEENQEIFSIIDKSDIFSVDSYIQMKAVAKICLPKLETKLKSLPGHSEERGFILNLIDFWKDYDKNDDV